MKLMKAAFGYMRDDARRLLEMTFSPPNQQTDLSLSNDLRFQKLAGGGIDRGPERIITDWRRFSCGLWRIPEGDISAAYCADTFPRLKVFSEAGQLFTNCGSCGRSLRMEADCYPLLPFDGSSLPKEQRFTYEGRTGKYKGTQFVLGAKVVFASTEPTTEEWCTQLQVEYADGGWFARQPSYGDFLSTLSPAQTENERRAIEREINSLHSTYSKIEMQHSLDSAKVQHSMADVSQLTLL
jgi:hypothetical protein